MNNDENKKEVLGGFGNVIDTLHNKSKLPSLRTYQGDMAEFIKEKNESVISVVVKEKEREEKREEEKSVIQPKLNKNNFQINFTILAISFFFIIGGGFALFYIFNYINKKPSEQILIQTDIISYNSVVTLANVTKSSFGSELIKSSQNTGLNIVRLSDFDGRQITRAQDFFDFLEISPAMSLRKTLKNDFVIGTFLQKENQHPFVIITVDDFGRAFSSMLDWEENMMSDFAFLNSGDNFSDRINFSWKDLIIKNKDARAFIDTTGNAKIVYTFLDKNTILIADSILIVADIASLYASRSVVR